MPGMQVARPRFHLGPQSVGLILNHNPTLRKGSDLALWDGQWEGEAPSLLPGERAMSFAPENWLRALGEFWR